MLKNWREYVGRVGNRKLKAVKVGGFLYQWKTMNSIYFYIPWHAHQIKSYYFSTNIWAAKAGKFYFINLTYVSLDDDCIVFWIVLISNGSLDFQMPFSFTWGLNTKFKFNRCVFIGIFYLISNVYFEWQGFYLYKILYSNIHTFFPFSF